MYYIYRLAGQPLLEKPLIIFKKQSDYIRLKACSSVGSVAY